MRHKDLPNYLSGQLILIHSCDSWWWLSTYLHSKTARIFGKHTPGCVCEVIFRDNWIMKAQTIQMSQALGSFPIWWHYWNRVKGRRQGPGGRKSSILSWLCSVFCFVFLSIMMWVASTTWSSHHDALPHSAPRNMHDVAWPQTEPSETGSQK